MRRLRQDSTIQRIIAHGDQKVWQDLIKNFDDSLPKSTVEDEGKDLGAFLNKVGKGF